MSPSIANTDQIILEVVKPKHCECCGQKTINIQGPYEVGPYRFVCKICHDLDFTWYPDKKIKPKGKIALLDKINFSDFPKRSLQILLVEPDYYTKFPPLGLLKIATYHRNRGDKVELLRIREQKKKIVSGSPMRANYYPDIIYVTSLFTWSWYPVWKAISYYKSVYPKSKVFLGGIYASVLPDHAAYSGADIIHEGLISEFELLCPAYDLVPDWKGSILFTTRGCIRRCSFCVVPKVEGRINSPKLETEIEVLLNNDFKKVFLWDNNILAAPTVNIVLEVLAKLNKSVDFNQGLDARLITLDIAKKLRKIRVPILHMAYDTKSARQGVERAIKLLKEVGFKAQKMIFYTLFNHKDTPEDFLERLQDLMNWGVVCYPMRFEPLTSLKKNQYVSHNWTKEQLALISKARRVIGHGGAFPARDKLVKKFTQAKSIEEAMELEPMKKSYNNRSEPLEGYF